MDSLLPDELLIEILHRIPLSSYSTVSLVSKRWLHLSRLARTSLSLVLPSPAITASSSSSSSSSLLLLSLSDLLHRYPFLSSLSLSSSSTASTSSPSQTATFDQLLITASSSCPHLQRLRFLAGPVSFPSLVSVSSSCAHLTSLTISLSRPLNFSWVASFLSLKELSLIICSRGVDLVGEVGLVGEIGRFDHNMGKWGFQESDVGLQLESLSVSGSAWGDVGMGWLWRNCRKLRKLQLRSCEGLGDGGSFSSFAECLHGLQEVELRTCRSIVDGVLLRLAENCTHLDSLLVYDGGSREGLLQFLLQCRSNVKKLDLRLPLDLNNDHLAAMASNLRNLSVLRLQSCCLVTGEGLKGYSIAASSELEELALTNCDVVDRVPGLLATLGQNMRRLRRLDLSYNELLVDKELASILVSCHLLVELKLRGCKGLTNAAVAYVIRSCKHLELVDIVHCRGIEGQAVEQLFMNLPRLRRLEVEELKVSDAARTRAENGCVEVVA
ncbi:hypothetical protein Dimus_027434 [Dionaea muscipula]